MVPTSPASTLSIPMALSTMTSFSNPDSTTYQFYYPGPEPLVDAMKRMIKDLKRKKHRKQARMEKKQEEIEVDESQFAAEDL